MISLVKQDRVVLVAGQALIILRDLMVLISHNLHKAEMPTDLNLISEIYSEMFLAEADDALKQNVDEIFLLILNFLLKKLSLV